MKQFKTGDLAPDANLVEIARKRLGKRLGMSASDAKLMEIARKQHLSMRVSEEAKAHKQLGEMVGKKWATQFAKAVELRRLNLAARSAPEDYCFSERFRSHRSVAEHIARDIDPSLKDQDDSEWIGFWMRATCTVPDDDDGLTTILADSNFLHGFVEGALVIWDAVNEPSAN